MKINFVPVIGLEIHTELKTKTKMFCECKNDPNETHPNINVCPICFGHPGTLPVINKEAILNVLKLGLALNSEIPEFSRFDRKHYFYPDLPKGYQISQYQYPLVKGGYLEIPILDKNIKDKNFQYKKIRITRIHLEEDTGSLEHYGDSSLVDLNRAGVPLMELVTEPDISSAYEAKKFAEELRLIMRYLGISEANMEKGQMRIEANISLRPENEEKLGTKVEIKNLNSFNSVERAVEYEISRQTEILVSGEKVAQETRGFNETKNITFSQRSKEEAEDYRYFPEPDLPPLKVREVFDLEKMKLEIPELPAEKRKRFKKEFNIKDEQIEITVSEKKFADYFENIVSEILAWRETEILAKQKIKPANNLIILAANYFTSDLLGIMKEKMIRVEEILITPEKFAELIKMIGENKISSRGAKDILIEMAETGDDPHILAEKMNLLQVSSESELTDAAKKIVELNPKAKNDFKNGNQNALQFLVGQMMRETRGKANPQIAQEIIKKILEN